MSSYNKKSLEDKLHRLNSSQESVETLSHWIIHHKQYAEESIRLWKDFFKESQFIIMTNILIEIIRTYLIYGMERNGTIPGNLSA